MTAVRSLLDRISLACLLVPLSLSAFAETVATDDFSAPSSGVGWADADDWDGTVADGVATVIDRAVFRALASPVDTSTLNRLRLSFDLARSDDTFAGVSLYDGDQEVLFVGRPFLADQYGIDVVAGAFETGGPAIDEAVHRFVLEIDFGQGADGRDAIRAFVDPEENDDPDVFFEFENVIDNLSQLRIATSGTVTVDNLTLEVFRKDDMGVDQFQLRSNINQAITADRPLGQTWTVGQTGLLSAIELSLFTDISAGELRLDVLDANNGWDPEAILGTVILAPTDLASSPRNLTLEERTATVIDLAPLGILAAAGDRLGVRLTSAVALPDFFALRMLTSDGYLGGDGFILDSPGELDAAFKSFMSPQSIPCGAAPVTSEGELAAAIDTFNADCGTDEVFAVTVEGTITLSAALPEIANPNGATLAITGGTVDGAGSFRSFSVTQGGLELHAITLQNGDLGAVGEGGAVRLFGAGARLDALDVQFLDNRAGFGGAVEVLAGATAWIEDSLFSGNHATTLGGALEAFDPDSTVTVLGTTFVGNSCDQRGGAVSLSAPVGDSYIGNSTFVGNRAGDLGGGIFANTTLTLVNSTFSDNIAAGGGAVWKQGDGTLSLRNTIQANSIDEDGEPIADCASATDSVVLSPGASNLVEQDDGCDLAGDRHIADDPALAPPAGSKPTLRPLPGSPVIDAGADDSAIDETGAPLDLDARGQPRFFGPVDLGAVERQPVLPFEEEVLVQYWPDESDETPCPNPLGFGERCLVSTLALRADRIAQLIDASPLAQSGLILFLGLQGVWPLEAVDSFEAESFVALTVTPEPGVAVTFDRLEYDGYSVFNGNPAPAPASVLRLRTSLDGFAANVASAPVPAPNVDYTLVFDLSALPAAIEAPIEIRLYPDNGGNEVELIDLRGPQRGRGGLRLIGHKELLGRELAPTRFDDPPPDGCFPDDCSLREAAIDAQLADVATRIQLMPGTYALTIPPDEADDPSTGDLDLETTVPITIAGAGMDETVLQASGDDRVLESSGIRLLDLTVRGGAADDGGGLSARSERPGAVTLKRVRFTDNESAGFGGGVRATARKVSIEDSLFEGNRAANGSALTAAFGPAVTLRRSTVRDNSAEFQAALNLQFNDVTRIEDSTVSDNRSQVSWPGGMLIPQGTIYLRNLTLSGNQAAGSGFGGGALVEGEVHVAGTTISGNTSTLVDGLFVRAETTGTLVGNIFDDACLLLEGAAFFTDGNVESGNSCGLAGPRDQVGLAPADLELLARAAILPGAPTLAPGPGSAAIGNASDFQCNVPGDQVGATRDPERCDTGAVQAPRPYCRTPTLMVPDGDPAGATDTLTIAGTGEVLLNLDVYLGIDHDEVGDIEVALTHQESGTVVMLVNQPRTADAAACGPGKLDTILADDALPSIDANCALPFEFVIDSVRASDYPLARYHPTELLGAFDKAPLDGTWNLTVTDRQSGATGTLRTWCLLPRIDEVFGNGFERPENIVP